MPPHRNYQQSKESSTKQPCRYCGNLYLPQGIKRHEGSCVKELQNHEERVKHNKAYIRDVRRANIAKEAAAATSSSSVHPRVAGSSGPDSTIATIPAPLGQPSVTVGPSRFIPGSPTSFVPYEDDVLMGMADPCGRGMSDSAHVMGRLVNSTAPDATNDHPPDFKTEFHPCSKRLTLFQFAEEFGQQNLECMPPDREPWRPFASEGDYIFASIAVEAGLSSNQVDSLLKLVHCISQGTTSVTLCNDAGLRTALDRAAAQLTLFSKFEITVPYKGNDVTFPVHIHPLWDWALDLLQNSSLAPHFVWDAQWLFKHDGERYEHFYTEPWTGDRWWDIQLPSHVDNMVPFTFIIYTDKTRLSSHGTVKGYPVVAHCTNLPVHVCNGERYGGGCVVGWLPIVPELAKEEGKTGYTNFKRVIWHTAFFQLLEKVAELSKVGYLHECYDKVLHWLFPLVLILSADYEELCVMTLIRGTKSKCPCPFCLVPLEQLWDLKKTYEMRTTEQHKRVLALFEEKKTVGEKKLKSLGLCPVKNAFWSVEHSEPEQAASFEPLHSLHGGMGGKHIHGELRIVVSELGRDSETRLEAQVSAFPRWQGLAHFDTVIHITFSDGNKMRDLTRQCFYASLNILTPMMSRVGYQLLRMISSYLRLDTLIGLDVHTEKTLGMIEDELLIFRDELKLYRSFVRHLDDTDLKDNWNFPKAHLWKHVTRDIRSKGVVCNYSAWPNEKMHGLLKDAYQDRSNGKDTAGQARINAENECVNDATNNDEDHNTVLEGNAKLGAPQQTRSLSDVENTNQNDWAFDGFRRKLETFLNTCLPTYGFPLDKLIHIPPKIREYQYLKVQYASMVDWEVAVNYLRCNPSFHGQPRYDGALIQLSETKTAFVRLIFMFTCKVAVFKDTFQFALVQLLTAGTGVCRLDQDLRLVRVKAVSRAASIFIPVKLIIRGALLYPDPSHHGEFLVVEHTDGDMFLRMREWIQTWPQAWLPTEQPSSSDSDQMPAEIQSDTSGSEQLDDLGGLLSTLLQNRKRAVENNPNMMLDNNIAAQAKKYCFFYHFWVPKDVFPLMIPPPGYDLNDPARWSTPESRIIGLKVELYSMLPSDLKARATTYSNFGRVFSNVVGAERPNILKPIKDNAQQLFAHLGLSADLFAAENSRILRGSNEDVKALLKMHPGSVGTHYTPLSPILFPKPDAPVARDLFKSQLLVNIIRVMVFGKGILTGKRRGGPQGRGQKLGISGALAGLIAVAATFARYLLSSDRELTTIGEESRLKYQDDFEYFIELLSDPSKREWSLEVMEFINQGMWNTSSCASTNTALDSSNVDASVAPTWESDILAQLNGPQRPTPPSHMPTPDSSFDSNPASASRHMSEATQDSSVVISQTNSVSSVLLVDVANLSLGGSQTSILPSVSAHGREFSVQGQQPRMVEVPGAVVGAMQNPPAVIAQELPTKECRITRHKVKDYTQALRFDNKPDYSYLHKLFCDLFIHKGFQYDFIFGWSVQHGVPKDGSAGTSQKVSAGRR
ncbi:hypothetical protein F5J12DRAFT_898070 [Pisolithus orientalis]|uniref:uncharacterized protein n=1 Tax=Pisolithus orientalis TaxID=936130 RepID=UPI002224ABCD|nr:uncharacterized protein F5J12DRAFT_898070 [Pisolithus orientalis]KAI5988874.1 hypothetical protein F5J12DRAFT_898070 [Pisolithus orientalis]